MNFIFAKKILFLSFIVLNQSCSDSSDAVTPSDDNNKKDPSIETKTTFKLIGEVIISNTDFESTTIGGLSGIDYHNGTYYVISDDPINPIRYYTMNLKFDADNFTSVEVTGVHKFLDIQGNPIQDNTVDPESIRFDPESNKIIWVSEGNVKSGIPPALFETGIDKITTASTKTPEILSLFGVIPNGALEGLSLSYDKKGYWIAMELPLFQDGNIPTFASNNSPVRISYIDKKSNEVTQQFAYNLDKLAIDPKGAPGSSINGLVEILSINDTEFYTLERSFSRGDNGGTVIKLFKTTITGASNIKDIASLKGADYNLMKKELIFNFDSIKEQLPSKQIDNIEGICFGPELSNGNKSLVFVADDNFKRNADQINQFIVLEVID